MIIANTGFSYWDYSVMAGYMFVVLGIGFYFSRKEETSEEYLLGGRSVPWWAVGMSYMMSLLSTYSLVMVPGEVYNNGMSLFAMNLLVPFIGIIAFHIFVRFYFKLKSFTPFEYLERRYNKNVRLLVSLIYFFSSLFYLGMVLFATTKVFQGGTGWPAWITILLVGIIGIAYTVMGGLRAVIWTDVFQFFVLVGGLGAVIYVASNLCDGGIPGIISYALSHGRGPDRFAESSFYIFDPYTRLCFWLLLVGIIIAPIQDNCANQITIQRLLSTSSYAQARKSIFFNAALVVPLYVVLWFMGFATFTYYAQHPDLRVISGDTALFTFISTKLPTPFPGLFFAAMLAAVMSTLDSGMNSLSTVWVKEFHQKYFNPDITEKQQVSVSRWVTFLIGALSIGLALLVTYTSELLEQSVVESQIIFGGLGVVIVPAFLFAVFSKRANSVVIWTMTFLCWGINLGMLHWYWVARLRPTDCITSTGLIVCVVLAAIIFALRFLPEKKKWHRVCSWISLFLVGYFLALLFWKLLYIYAGPGELSFQWVGFPGLVIFLVAGALATAVSKRQNKEKYEGMILFSMDKTLP